MQVSHSPSSGKRSLGQFSYEFMVKLGNPVPHCSMQGCHWDGIRRSAPAGRELRVLVGKTTITCLKINCGWMQTNTPSSESKDILRRNCLVRFSGPISCESTRRLTDFGYPKKIRRSCRFGRGDLALQKKDTDDCASKLFAERRTELGARKKVSR
jgi:hypothetical protein